MLARNPKSKHHQPKTKTIKEKEEKPKLIQHFFIKTIEIHTVNPSESTDPAEAGRCKGTGQTGCRLLEGDQKVKEKG